MVRNDEFWGGVGRSMDFPSVYLPVTRCALQLARGHSKSERGLSPHAIASDMYSCVLNRTDCAASISS